MKLLIINHINCHYEIIESIIIKYYEILNIDKNTPIDIYLSIFDNLIFKNYILNKYPTIKFGIISDYDYYINCTIYDNDFDKLENKSNKKYISHQITDRLKTNKNVYFLTPLAKNNFIYADILPYSNNKIKSDIPIYIIQGCLSSSRRNYDLLKKKILDNTYDYKFIIKLIGFEYENFNELNQYKDKVIIKSNLNFIDYHKEFLIHIVYCH